MLLPSSGGQFSHFITDDGSTSSHRFFQCDESRARAHAHHVVQDDGRPYISTFSGFNVSFMRLNSVREGEGIGGGVQALTLPAVMKRCPSIKPTSLWCSRLSTQETSSEEP